MMAPSEYDPTRCATGCPTPLDDGHDHLPDGSVVLDFVNPGSRTMRSVVEALDDVTLLRVRKKLKGKRRPAERDGEVLRMLRAEYRRRS